MKLRSKIIGGSYGYIGGIVLAMLAPADPGWVPMVQLLAAAGLLVALGLVVWAETRSTDAGARLNRWVWLSLLTGVLALGYGRYTDANTVPDMRVGMIQLGAAEATLAEPVTLPDTSRVRLRKMAPTTEDVQIQLQGQLLARTPVRDERGVHRMDEAGRWLFERVSAPMQSAVITIAAADPVGTEYAVEQPFNAIEQVEVLAGRSDGAVAIYRISNHIGSFVRPMRAQSPVIVLGRVTGDPRVYDFKTILMVTPAYIQFPAGGPFYKVEGGDVQVTLNPEMTGYRDFARTQAYGADVQIEAELTMASSAANPGGFDARKFLQNYNIYGLMRPYQGRGQPPPVYQVAPAGGEVRAGNPLVQFSLGLRDRILLLFKATMPYPQSAFLGGVTLGLRYGLQGAQFPGEGIDAPWAERLGLGPSEATIVDDFRSSGVNHVLAVSGLHVTILTAMFIGIFSLLKFPKQVFVPFVVFALVVFAVITGARPSTLRAVIMNSLFLITWAYLNQGLIASVLIGVPVAAFLILLHNPLVVVDPSFTLSFGAILSLVLITDPVHTLLKKLRGNRFAVVTGWVVATTWIGIVQWALVTTPSFLLVWLGLGGLAFWIAGRLDADGVGVPQRFAFAAIPDGVSTFLAAQIAIQIGMMVPLSGYYFMRWPFAGAFANLIAIPLIGVVVQLGAIGGLLGLIPVVGPFLTLLLNAANWVFASFFLWLAHVSTLLFPYPVIRRPRVIDLLVFYAFLAAFIWHRPLWQWIQRVCQRRQWTARYAPASMAMLLGVLTLLPLVLAPPRDTRPEGLHVTVLSVGYGGAVLIESPGGQRILVDTAFVERTRSRRNEADRTVLSFLSHQAIGELDGLIISSVLPERSAGAATILRQLPVEQVYVPPVTAGWTPDMTLGELRSALVRSGRAAYPLSEDRIQTIYHEWIGHPEWPQRSALIPELAKRDDRLLHRWSGWDAQVATLQAGSILFAEAGERPFRIEVLGTSGAAGVANQGVSLRVVYGDFAMLIGGTMDYDGQYALAQAGAPTAQVLLVPHQGAAHPGGGSQPERTVVEAALARGTAALFDRVQPEVALLEWGNPRPVLGMDGRTAINLYGLTRRFYQDRLGAESVLSTDRDHAIMVYSDGMSYALETQAMRNQAEGGEEDAVSDLAVGL